MKTKDIKLPKPLLATDLKYPKGRNTKVAYNAGFEMFYTEKFGWVIPVLLIKRASRRARAAGVETDRYYAISVNTHEMVSVGHGPHVLKHVRVVVKESRLKALKKLIDLKETGTVLANEIRDSRSRPRVRRSRWSY